MIKNTFRTFAAVVFGVVFASFGLAQTSSVVSAAGDKYVISAKAGGVNLVEGTVNIVRKDGKSGHLIKGETIEIGDRVTTGPNGRAEILLNPGSYLRLDTNSAFEFGTTSLDDLQLLVDHGSAMFEVFASNEFKVTVRTPNAKFILIESGVFRVDVMQNGGGKISVWEGSAQLGDADQTIVKKGRTAIFDGQASKVAKFDKGYKDDLIAWSKLRAKQLADASASLRNNQNVRNSLIRSYMGGGWGMFSSFGLWVYDARFGGYCFLPFGSGWGSPYGYSYGNCSCYYYLPPAVYNPPIWSPPPTGGPVAPATVRIASGGDRTPMPPFLRMQQTSGSGGGGGLRGFDSGSGSDPGGYSRPPSYSPPASTPIPESRSPAPAPAPPPAADPPKQRDGHR